MFGRKIWPGPLLLAVILALAVMTGPAAAFTIGGDTYTERVDHALDGVTGTTLPYHLERFTLMNTSGVNGGEVLYTGGATAPDWRDLRFASTTDGVYPHWIETTNATSATAWVNVTSIPEAGTTLRIYFGSATAAQTSNGPATYPLFEEFDGTALDSKWTKGASSTVTVQNGYADVSGPEAYALRLNTNIPANAVIDVSLNSWLSGTGMAVIVRDQRYTSFVMSKGYLFRYIGDQMSVLGKSTGGYGSLDTTGATIGTKTDFTRTITLNGSSISDNYNLAATDSTYSSGGVGFYLGWGNFRINSIRARPYAATEPTHGTYTAIVSPVAALSADVTSGDRPLAVHFTDASTGSAPDSWDWDFGDGSPHSTDQNPTHEYTVVGVYSVTLQVTNGAGSDAVTQTDYITVSEPYAVPVAAFSANVTEGMAPVAVAFVDASTGPPVEWVWEFTGPDGFYDLDLRQNPNMTFTAPGTYTVSLQVSNPAGNDYENKTEYITVLALPAGPVASFTADAVSGHAPLTVSFTDTSTGPPIAWAWDFDGDAVVDSTDQNPTHEYAANGTYTVTLQVSNAGGTDLETKTGYVYVGELTARLLRASFSYSAPIGTAPFSVSFTDETVSNGTYTRMWDFGDGTTSFDAAPVHEYAAAGKYDVELVVSSDFVQDKSTARKAVMAYPAAAVSPLPTTTYGAHMTEIMESNWNVSVIGPIIPRAYTDALTPLTGDTGVGNMIFWGIIWVGVFMILFLRQGTPGLAALVGLVAGPGILTFLPPEWAHVGYICLVVTIGCSFFVIALGRFRST